MNYPQHILSNSIIGTITTSLLTLYTDFSTPIIATFAISFVVATIFLSPDLDLLHSTPAKNWGVFKFLWLPYGLIFRHRGLSHGLLTSTITKVMYIAIIAVLGVCFYHLFFSIIPFVKDIHLIVEMDQIYKSISLSINELITLAVNFTLNNKEIIVAGFAGIFLSDVSHIMTDKFAF